MKIRITEEQIRVRLSQEESRQLADGIGLQTSVRIDRNHNLSFNLRSAESDGILCVHLDNSFHISVPSHTALELAEGLRPSIRRETSDEEGSEIVIEVDLS